MKNMCVRSNVYQEHGKGEKVHIKKELRKYAGVSAETKGSVLHLLSNIESAVRAYN